MFAVNGGEKTKTTPWPKWPVVNQESIDLVLQSVSSDKWSYKGPFEKQLKDEWCKFTGAKHTYAIANGTVTLMLALEALGIGYGDEVIVPGLTWQATAACVLDINAVPILVDVEEDSWCIDPKEIEKNITPKTKAIIVVHLYGTICDMDAIMDIAKRHNLYVIEDCAHQHGSFYKGKHVGTIGDIGSFSLQNSKTLTCGEGGLLITNNDEVALKLDALRNCGRHPLHDDSINENDPKYVKEGSFIQSGNYRMTDYQCALLLGQLKMLKEQVAYRDEKAIYLNSMLAEIDGIKPLRREKGTEIQSYFNFGFLYEKSKFNNRSLIDFCKILTAELGIEFQPCYQPLNNCELYKPLTKKRYAINEEHLKAIDPARFDLPVSTKLHKEAAPCCHHALLMGTKEDMDLVVKAIRKIQSNY